MLLYATLWERNFGAFECAFLMSCAYFFKAVWHLARWWLGVSYECLETLLSPVLWNASHSQCTNCLRGASPNPMDLLPFLRVVRYLPMGVRSLCTWRQLLRKERMRSHFITYFMHSCVNLFSICSGQLWRKNTSSYYPWRLFRTRFRISEWSHLESFEGSS